MNLTRARSRDRGFAAIVAISLIAFVALAVTVVMQSFVADARHTSDEAAAAQLRQLVTAGELVAAERLAQNRIPAGASPVEVQLPRELGAEGAQLTMTLTSDGQVATSRVEARMGPHRAVESTIDWRRVAAGWKIATLASD